MTTSEELKQIADRLHQIQREGFNFGSGDMEAQHILKLREVSCAIRNVAHEIDQGDNWYKKIIE